MMEIIGISFRKQVSIKELNSLKALPLNPFHATGLSLYPLKTSEN